MLMALQVTDVTKTNGHNRVSELPTPAKAGTDV